jgi:hypothetical protein
MKAAAGGQGADWSKPPGRYMRDARWWVALSVGFGVSLFLPEASTSQLLIRVALFVLTLPLGLGMWLWRRRWIGRVTESVATGADYTMTFIGFRRFRDGWGTRLWAILKDARLPDDVALVLPLIPGQEPWVPAGGMPVVVKGTFGPNPILIVGGTEAALWPIKPGFLLHVETSGGWVPSVTLPKSVDGSSNHALGRPAVEGLWIVILGVVIGGLGLGFTVVVGLTGPNPLAFAFFGIGLLGIFGAPVWAAISTRRWWWSLVPIVSEPLLIKHYVTLAVIALLVTLTITTTVFLIIRRLERGYQS